MATMREVFCDHPDILASIASGCYTYRHARNIYYETMRFRKTEHAKLYSHLDFDDYWELYDMYGMALLHFSDICGKMTCDEIVAFMYSEGIKPELNGRF